LDAAVWGVTFLFTDIEGSTRRWESDADDMQRALSAHDDALVAAVGAHEGWLFKHTGDGVCAAFASPRSALDAAVAAQRALELPVRMGIATGVWRSIRAPAIKPMRAGTGERVLAVGQASRVRWSVRPESDCTLNLNMLGGITA